MGKLISMNVHGIKCDTLGCGWNDMSVSREDYPYWVEACCPNCGGNLLTEADYRTVQAMERSVNLVNFWLGWTTWFRKPGGVGRTPAYMKGDGSIMLGEREPVDDEYVL